MHEHLEICQLILDNVEDKNPADNYRITPLHEAARGGHLSVFKLLLEHSPEKNPKNSGGVTPFHFAAREGHSDICKLIEETVLDGSVIREGVAGGSRGPRPPYDFGRIYQ